MEWSGRREFVASPELPFEVNGSEAGVLKSYGPLAFLKVSLCLTMIATHFMISANVFACYICQQVHDAGHMVPMDQPEASLEMLKRWIEGTLSETTDEPEKLVSEM